MRRFTSQEAGMKYLDPGGLLLRLLPLRDRPRSRGHRLHQPAGHQRVPGPQRGPTTRRCWVGSPSCWSVSSRSPRCCSMPGHPMCTRGHRRRWSSTWCRASRRPVRRAAAHVRRRLRHPAARMAADRLRAGRVHPAGGHDPRRRADRREADDGLLADLPRRLHPRRRAGRQRGRRSRAVLPGRLHVHDRRHVRDHHAGRPAATTATTSTTTGAWARNGRCWPSPSPCCSWPRPGCR